MGQTKDWKRIGLLALTAGTSEMKTGGGANKDETVADTLFPKAGNDWALDDRTKERAKVITDQEAENTALDLKAGNAKRAPDLADSLNQSARSGQMLRMLSSKGRGSTFLTGPTGTGPLGTPK